MHDDRRRPADGGKRMRVQMSIELAKHITAFPKFRTSPISCKQLQHPVRTSAALCREREIAVRNFKMVGCSSSNTPLLNGVLLLPTMRKLATSKAGFISSLYVNRPLAENVMFEVCENYSTGTYFDYQLYNILDLDSNSCFHLMKWVLPSVVLILHREDVALKRYLPLRRPHATVTNFDSIRVLHPSAWQRYDASACVESGS